MVATWILGGIGLLFLLLLAARVRILVDWQEDISVELRYLFLRLMLYPAPEKPTKKKKKKEPPPEKAEKTKKTGVSGVQQLLEYAHMLPPLLSSAAKQLRFVLRQVVVTNTVLTVVVAEEDAAQTAIKYGQVNAGVYTAYGAAKRMLRLKERKIKIDITPGFLEQESSVAFCCCLKIPVWAGVWAAIRLGKDVLVQLLRETRTGKQTERTERMV